MKEIQLLPKWYGAEERKERSNQMSDAVNKLLKCDISEKAMKEITGITTNLDLIRDTYSRNYEIKILNKWIRFYKEA